MISIDNKYQFKRCATKAILLRTYNMSEIIKYIPIKKKDLQDLTEIIMEKNPPYDIYAFISTDIDTLCIEEKSIESFLAHKEVLDLLSNYRVYYREYVDQKRFIDLKIHESFSFLQVSGPDEAWVLGKFQQIKKFLNSKLDQYNEEQKQLDKNETIELNKVNVAVPKSILQRFEKKGQLEKAMLFVTILLLIIGILQLISMWK